MAPGAIGELPSRHVLGHHHVGEQEIDPLVAFDLRQRLRPVLREQDAVAKILQGRAGELQHAVIVLGDQHGFATPGGCERLGFGIERLGSRCHRRFLGQPRQIDFHRCARAPASL